MRNGLLQGLLKNKENKLAKILNSSLHYVEDVTEQFLIRWLFAPHIIKLNYRILLTITCLLLMKIKTQLFDKLDDFNFPIVNFPFISSNIPAAPAYGVYMLQLIRYLYGLCTWQWICEHSSAANPKDIQTQSRLKSSLIILVFWIVFF